MAPESSSNPSGFPALKKVQAGLLIGLIVMGVGAWFWLTRLGPTKPTTDHWATVKKAQGLLDQGRPDLAVAAVNHIRDDKPGAADAMRIAGESFVAMKNLSMARKAFERSLQLNSEQPKAALTTAALCLSMSDAPRGLEYLKLAARLEPTHFRPWQTMGIVHKAMGEPEQAVASYRKGLELKPDEWPLRINLIAGLLEIHREDEIPSLLKEGEQQRPQDPLLMGLRARYLLSQGQIAEAARSCDACLAQMPRNLDALQARFQMRRQTGKLKDARDDLLEILQIEPNDLGFLQSLAQLEKALGNKEASDTALQRHQKSLEHKTSMDQFTREISERPDDPEPRYQLGQLALQMGQVTLARQSFEAAIHVDPKHQAARQALDSLKNNSQ